MIVRAVLRVLVVGAAIGTVWVRLGNAPATMLAAGFVVGVLWASAGG